MIEVELSLLDLRLLDGDGGLPRIARRRRALRLRRLLLHLGLLREGLAAAGLGLGTRLLQRNDGVFVGGLRGREVRFVAVGLALRDVALGEQRLVARERLLREVERAFALADVGLRRRDRGFVGSGRIALRGQRGLGRYDGGLRTRRARARSLRLRLRLRERCSCLRERRLERRRIEARQHLALANRRVVIDADRGDRPETWLPTAIVFCGLTVPEAVTVWTKAARDGLGDERRRRVGAHLQRGQDQPDNEREGRGRGHERPTHPPEAALGRRRGRRSSGRPIRPIFIELSRSVYFFSGNALTISVAMNPGAIAFTRMFFGASSFAAERVRPITPAFDAP